MSVRSKAKLDKLMQLNVVCGVAVALAARKEGVQVCLLLSSLPFCVLFLFEGLGLGLSLLCFFLR